MRLPLVAFAFLASVSLCHPPLALCAPAPAHGGIPETIPADAGNLSFVAQKIRTGQPVRVGFIGGSITQGAGTKNHGDSYYWQTKQRLSAFAKKTGSTIEAHLAAVGGTGTEYGVYRVGAQLLEKDLDLLVVEFAVNDYKNPAALDGMEGIVRQALLRNPHMGIVLFHTTSQSAQTEYYDKDALPPSVVAFHKVAQHYRLAEVLSGPRVRAVIQSGQATLESFFPDKTHPSKDGHALYACLLSDALIDALSAPAPAPAPVAVLPASLGSGQLARARLLPLVPVEKTGNWAELKPGYYTYHGSWKSEAPGASLSFDVQGERITLLCGKVTRLRVSGPGLDKIITHRGRPGGIPTMQLLHAGPQPFVGRITVTVEPDDKGNAEAELAGLAVITLP